MANDPHRDLLPVKDTDSRVGKGNTVEKIDHHLLSKLKRSELEDRYLRLFDENTQIKKQLNNQEEKLKRLGTKLLRLLNDKKNGTEPGSRKQFEENRAIEELQMRIVELEHENYTLKDKNVVLKQQLANHSRQHVAAHRSPVRSIHASPRMSQRQSSAPNINESSYELSNRNPAAEQQLQEAEGHITSLNDEIKSLHDKIDCLQQDLEKSCHDNQRNKVAENIELIRLQRSLKQQSIQIAALQAQVKNSENNQKVLRDDLAKAHRENEEALQIVADKQNEVLDLYTKLEEKSLSRLEQEELRERINDLMSERDSLKERSEFLLKTISTNAKDIENVNELKRLLAQEKSKKEELSHDLEATRKMLQNAKSESTIRTSSYDQSNSNKQRLTVDITPQTVSSTQTSPERYRVSLTSPRSSQSKELQLLVSTQIQRPNSASSGRSSRVIESTDIMDSSFTARVLDSLAKSEQTRTPVMSILRDNEDFKSDFGTAKKGPIEKTKKGCKQVAINIPSPALSPANCKCGMASCACSPNVSDDQNQPEFTTECRRKSPTPVQTAAERERKHTAEKMCLEREINYLRQMLKNQALRCEAQQAEIGRLSYELKLNEEKYSDTLRRLDLHLKIFQHLEFRMLQDDKQQLTDEQRSTILSYNSEMTSDSVGQPKKEESKAKEIILPLQKPAAEVIPPPPAATPAKEKNSQPFTPVKEINSTSFASAKEVISSPSTPAKESVSSVPSTPVKGTISSVPSTPSKEPEKSLMPVRETDSEGSPWKESEKTVPSVKKDSKEIKSERELKTKSLKKTSQNSMGGPKESLKFFTIHEQKQKFRRASEADAKKRFVDRQFLSSSEEEEEEEELSVEKELTTKLYDSPSKASTSPKGWKKQRAPSLVNTEESPVPVPAPSVRASIDTAQTKFSGTSLISTFPSESNFNFSKIKNKKGEHRDSLRILMPVPKPRASSLDSKVMTEDAERRQSLLARHDRFFDKKSAVKITVEWLKLEKNCTVWKDEDVKLLFVDFSFLDVQGEETETPHSLPKPKKPDERCEFNFSKQIEMNEKRKTLFKNVIQKPDNEIIVFKIVSDPEDFPDDFDCVDLGTAVVTVDEFFRNGSGQLLTLRVRNINDTNELIGTLAVTLNASPDIFLLRSPVI